jgi:hypothetical protein
MILSASISPLSASSGVLRFSPSRIGLSLRPVLSAGTPARYDTRERPAHGTDMPGAGARVLALAFNIPGRGGAGAASGKGALCGERLSR